jgi:hypothetical protein
MSRSQRAWNAVKNVTIVISLVVNIILISMVLILASQIGAIKATLNSVVGQLDTAFVALGDAVIQDTIHIDQRVPVKFDLNIAELPGTAITTEAVPLNIPATFSLGTFGQINGTVSLSLPSGLTLPMRISMIVPVNSEIPVIFDQSVVIPLGARGLAPVINQLRGVTQPLMQTIQTLPDSIP